MSCEQCLRETGIDRSITRPPLQKLNGHITAPEDAMQKFLLPEMPPTASCETFATAMDVFYCYLFA